MTTPHSPQDRDIYWSAIPFDEHLSSPRQWGSTFIQFLVMWRAVEHARPSTSDGFRTLALHVDSEPDLITRAGISPISLSTTFTQSSVGIHKSNSTPYDALGKLFASLEPKGGEALTFSSKVLRLVQYSQH